jgi:hypothetical protein
VKPLLLRGFLVGDRWRRYPLGWLTNFVVTRFASRRGQHRRVFRRVYALGFAAGSPTLSAEME